MSSGRCARMDRFEFGEGEIIAGKYGVLGSLGGGYEGEVYKVRELSTGVERAAKFFYPQRNQRNKAVRFYARKLHKLRECGILIQYHTRETIEVRDTPITFLVSDYADGELLCDFVKRQPGRRLSVFEGLHLLHSLAEGLQTIHDAGEYHGDIHDDNVIVRRRGIGFDVKLVDMYNWGVPSSLNISDDVWFLVKVFYETIGGAKWYPKHPQHVKDICCGLKRSLIRKRYKTAGHLRRHLESLDWDE